MSSATTRPMGPQVKFVIFLWVAFISPDLASCVAGYYRCPQGADLEIISSTSGKVLIPKGVCGKQLLPDELQEPPYIRLEDVNVNANYSVVIVRNNTNNGSFTIDWQLVSLKPDGEYLVNNRTNLNRATNVEYMRPVAPGNYTLFVFEQHPRRKIYSFIGRLVDPLVFENLVGDGAREVSRVNYAVVNVLPFNVQQHEPHDNVERQDNVERYPLHIGRGSSKEDTLSLPRYPLRLPSSIGPMGSQPSTMQPEIRPWTAPNVAPSSTMIPPTKPPSTTTLTPKSTNTTSVYHGSAVHQAMNTIIANNYYNQTNSTSINQSKTFNTSSSSPLQPNLAQIEVAGNRTNVTKAHGPTYHLFGHRSSAVQNYASPGFIAFSIVCLLQGYTRYF